MRIEVFSDVICPWCFIGKRRLERALSQRPDVPVEIVWRAYQLNPWMPAEGMDRAQYLAAKFGSADAGRVYDTITQVGKTEGLDFRFDLIPRTPNTVDAHRLIRRAGGEGMQGVVVESLFRAYFFEGRNLGSRADLARIAGTAGMDEAGVRAWLDTDGDAEAVRQEDALARRMGIQGVPCFIVDRRWAISGAQEPEYFMPLFDLSTTKEAAE